MRNPKEENTSHQHELAQGALNWLKRLLSWLKLRELDHSFENQNSQLLAQWGLENYLLSKHHLLKVFYPNLQVPEISLALLSEEPVTVLRIHGEGNYEDQAYFWFVLIRQKNDELVSFQIQGDTNQSTLVGNISDFSFDQSRHFSAKEVNKPVQVEKVLNELLGIMKFPDLAAAKELAITFSGGPEKAATSHEEIEPTEVLAIGLVARSN